jgi:organic radical activating enzyme
MDDIAELIHYAHDYGCQSVTITGGGEPTLHPDFDEMITKITDWKIQVGLVTNGTRLPTLKTLDKITWIRISTSDHMVSQLTRAGYTFPDYIRALSVVIDKHPKVDWAFSYVLAGEKWVDIELIKDLIEFANNHQMTHMRIVNDILEVEEAVSQMDTISSTMKSIGVDDSLVNYQDRSSYTKGVNPCLISLLKPVISADGGIFPCCGTQYALENPSRDYEKQMLMGDISEFEEIVRKQQFFDGSNCVKCYYNNYNEALSIIQRGIIHKAFV